MEPNHARPGHRMRKRRIGMAITARPPNTRNFRRDFTMRSTALFAAFLAAWVLYSNVTYNPYDDPSRSLDSIQNARCSVAYTGTQPCAK